MIAEKFFKKFPIAFCAVLVIAIAFEFAFSNSALSLIAKYFLLLLATMPLLAIYKRKDNFYLSLETDTAKRICVI
jgi:hypothetical protein